MACDCKSPGGGLSYLRVALVANTPSRPVQLPAGRYELRTEQSAAVGSVFVADRRNASDDDGVPFCAEAPLSIHLPDGGTLHLRSSATQVVTIRSL